MVHDIFELLELLQNSQNEFEINGKGYKLAFGQNDIESILSRSDNFSSTIRDS